MVEIIDIDFSLAGFVLGLIVFDIITGILKAFKNGSFRSSSMYDGLWKKAGSVCMLLLAALLTIACQVVDVFPQEFALVYVPVCAALALMEVASILENIGDINPDLKKYKIFEIFNSDNQTDKEEEYKEEIIEIVEEMEEDTDGGDI